jgi:hypothetical protein
MNEVQAKIYPVKYPRSLDDRKCIARIFGELQSNAGQWINNRFFKKITFSNNSKIVFQHALGMREPSISPTPPTAVARGGDHSTIDP